MLKLFNSTFQFTDHEFDSSQGVFIISQSEVSIFFSNFSNLFKLQTASLIELEMTSQMISIRHFDITSSAQSGTR